MLHIKKKKLNFGLIASQQSPKNTKAQTAKML